jgi:hypothetical protein
LIVIAIVAVLVSILAPSLARARAAARRAACVANLRAWGAAFHLYASHHDGLLPHTDDRARNRPPGAYDPAHPEHECCYIDVLPALMGGRRPWRDFPAGAKPQGGVWQCPTAQPLDDAAYSPAFRPRQAGYHSYAMNSYLACDFTFGLHPGVDPYPSFLELARCKAPALTILLFEQTLDPACGYGRQGGHTTAGRYTAEDARALGERHSRREGGLGGYLIFLDGHVGWRDDLWEEDLPNPRVPARGDLTWFPY